MDNPVLHWLPLTWLIPMLPLSAALALWLRSLLQTNTSDASEAFSAHIAQGAALCTLAGLIALSAQLTITPLQNSHVFLGTWFQVDTPHHIDRSLNPSLGVSFSLLLDPLALGFACLFTLLICIILSFSRRYMHREAGFHRFFAALSLFLSGMLLIILAGNALLAFIGWELAGVASFLLIAYAQQRDTTADNALRAFITNRLGDAAFLMSIGFSLAWAGTLEWPLLAQRVREMESVNASLIVIGFLFAALVKSAQIPFSSWIARALEGPTPSSAIFYGGLYAHAGVFLILRLQDFFQSTPQLSWLLITAGLATCFYSAFCALLQNDIKSSLLYSTLGQIGLMFIACGLGFFTFASVHLAAHVIFRTWQFLHAPSWLALSERAPPALPTWLRENHLLYSTALQRFWLELIGDHLLTHPTQRLGKDMANIDNRIIEPLLPKLTGLLLEKVAARLAHFEYLLLVQKNGGRAATLLLQIGQLLIRIERLLEQPRYLFLFVFATLIVIL